MEVSGSQSWSGRGGKEKKFLPLPGMEPQSSSPWPSHCIDWAHPAQIWRTTFAEGSVRHLVENRCAASEVKHAAILSTLYEEPIKDTHKANSQKAVHSTAVSCSLAYTQEENRRRRYSFSVQSARSERILGR